MACTGNHDGHGSFFFFLASPDQLSDDMLAFSLSRSSPSFDVVVVRGVRLMSFVMVLVVVCVVWR